MQNTNTKSANSNWLRTVFSDGTAQFLSNPEPALREKVTIRIRMAVDNPVKIIWISIVKNGETRYVTMEPDVIDGPFQYYKGVVEMTQQRMQYQFLLQTDEQIYFYTQAGITTSFRDRIHDFVVMTDYHQPAWLKDAVFYQIFPERFCNGDASLDVQDGEYQVNGYDTIKIKDWNTPAGTYDQCHCADFYGGDLVGIKEKIPYLKELGVNAVYLNPIFTAPSVHKYDCIDYLHVDPHFGGDEALADLSKALHENDMKLIVDISINHTGTAHRWFNKDGLYFDKSIGAYNNPDAPERDYYMIHEDGSYEGWNDVPELPKLNYTSDKLRDALYRAEDSVLKKWLKPPYSIDGWRFDVADVMANYNEHQLGAEVWPEICSHLRATNPECFILAEHWDDCVDKLQGDCWDSPMNYYAFCRIIRQFYGVPDPYAELNPKMWKCTCKISAEDFRARVENYLSRLPFPMWQNQYNLYDSHDVGRFGAYPGITNKKIEGAALAMFTMVGIPSIYYGDEADIGGMIGFFEGARYPMPWNSGFENSDTYKFYKTLTHLRKDHRVFSEGSFQFLYAKDDILAFARFDKAETFITVLSASDADQEITIPTGILGKTADTIYQDYFQQELNMHTEADGDLTLLVKAGASYLLQENA